MIHDADVVITDQKLSTTFWLEQPMANFYCCVDAVQLPFVQVLCVILQIQRGPGPGPVKIALHGFDSVMKF